MRGALDSFDGALHLGKSLCVEFVALDGRSEAAEVCKGKKVGESVEEPQVSLAEVKVEVERRCRCLRSAELRRRRIVTGQSVARCLIERLTLPFWTSLPLSSILLPPPSGPR